MTHLPYIVAAYGLTIGVAMVLSINATLRLRQARRRLAAIEQPGRTRQPS
ncbi:heme exporter protein CcmD [Komagataeibacter melaceti]|uniref:Heme exporter protein D n=1 Tax=Komagataeibacter melaceti TaxID=2766577 RepID=A0A371Z2Q7_9PROT|nr:heme exporter protein CcmD [Komagataeibacter melaceti]RFD20761.1 heme exporter protein CcmD [Komagataeibacter melaceti]